MMCVLRVFLARAIFELRLAVVVGVRSERHHEIYIPVKIWAFKYMEMNDKSTTIMIPDSM